MLSLTLIFPIELRRGALSDPHNETLGQNPPSLYADTSSLEGSQGPAGSLKATLDAIFAAFGNRGARLQSLAQLLPRRTRPRETAPVRRRVRNPCPPVTTLEVQPRPQRLVGRVQDDMDVSMALNNLQEAIGDYKVRSRPSNRSRC